ncbi:hypothetical protein HN510_05320 [Candidatus Woesearchaeota archaeon]|nr:hypothetical protein [Candidatus Woesearchaeota archaeon]
MINKTPINTIRNKSTYSSPIPYPHTPENLKIVYVTKNNPFMKEALRLREYSGCFKQQTAAVIVKLNEIIGQGWNGPKDAPSKKLEGIETRLDNCPKDKKGFETGQGYHLCEEICGNARHAEQEAIADAKEHGFELEGADVYLAGHWWACKPCCDGMEKNGTSRLIMEKNATKLYNPKFK